jgi:hypothetical protein
MRAIYAALPKIATASRAIVHFCQSDILIAPRRNQQSPIYKDTITATRFIPLFVARHSAKICPDPDCKGLIRGRCAGARINLARVAGPDLKQASGK